MSEQNNTVPCVAVSVGADFESGTWTFEPVGDFVVGAGRYVIVPESVYVSDKQGVMLEALKKAKHMLERDYIDAQKLAVIELCDDAITRCEVSA